MHAFTHSLAHRAPSATRPRVRWQPYNPLSQSSSSSSISTRSPSSSQISTPSSSISSPPSNTPLPDSKPSSQPQNIKEPSLPRDSTKKQFAVGLVDQAVKTLAEIWRPQDIPTVFLTSSRAGAAIGGPLDTHISNFISTSSGRVAGSTPLVSSPSGCGHDSRAGLVPIKGFVHEVIRRSRTSGCVLQTALCYLEAIRTKVPDLVRKEQAGEGIHGEPDISNRIMPATELELELEEQYLQLETCDVENPTISSSNDLVPTIRIADIQTSDSSLDSTLDLPSSVDSSLTSPDSIPQITTLPSPLLCPRRTFLASLILASKFTQDKCYSNRAWAKLSGLPAREIGRCERALGDALEWRLWVGKAPVQSSQASGSTTAGASSTRPVARSQSESNILSTPATRSPFLIRQDPRPPVALVNSQRVLQRSSTMPVEAFACNPPRAGGLYCKNPQELLDCVQPTLASGQVSTVSYTDTLSQSPSPDNPGLSYSPSSTESSSGDRTIQMSTFIDEPMAMYSAPQAPTVTDFWPCLDNGDSHELRISPLVLTKSNRGGKAPVVSDHLGLYASASVPGVATGGDFLLPPGYIFPSSNPPWASEGEILRPLPVMSQ